MIYIIDHKDSFTHNLVHQFESFDNVVCDNYDEINENKLNKANVIVFSPGPGAPKNYPISSNIYKKFKGQKKIIGILVIAMRKDQADIGATTSQLHTSSLRLFFGLLVGIAKHNNALATLHWCKTNIAHRTYRPCS